MTTIVDWFVKRSSSIRRPLVNCRHVEREPSRFHQRTCSFQAACGPRAPTERTTLIVAAQANAMIAGCQRRFSRR